jgi:adenylylsulfate kinase-like enzyme
MIVVLFGQPGSGKTTLAKELAGFVKIDGDVLRSMFNNADYSRHGRMVNLNRASDIAHFINSTGSNVSVAVVYPYKEARDYLNSLTTDVKWIYLEYTGENTREHLHVKDFDFPTDEKVLRINTHKMSIEDCRQEILMYIHGTS